MDGRERKDKEERKETAKKREWMEENEKRRTLYEKKDVCLYQHFFYERG